MKALPINIEEANERIHELEKALGLPRSADVEQIDAAWSRLELLEEMAAAATYAERNAQIHALEAKLGLPRSSDAFDAHELTNRLEYLNEIARQRGVTAPTPAAASTATPAPQAPRTAPVASQAPTAAPAAPAHTGGGKTGIARAIAANQSAQRGAQARDHDHGQPAGLSGIARAIAANKALQSHK